MKKLKIRFVTFPLSKYGGIFQQNLNRMKTFKDMGHDVDLILLDFKKNVNEKTYQKKIAELENGTFQESKELHSQNGGYEKSELGIWGNSYYGWVLKPITNHIPCFHPDALSYWHKAVDDCDIIFWHFPVTKQNESEGFSDWWKYFDLPKRIKQVLTIHDSYIDKRLGWISALKDKLLFLDACQITCYNACENFNIPRAMFLNWRIFPEKMYENKMSNRSVDFFSAHIFKSMKKIEELMRAVPYLERKYSVMVGGSGIEYSYMTSKDKCKGNYICSVKKDPDLPKAEEGKTVWNRALEYGAEYVGMLGNSQMELLYKESKFMIDPSWSDHYAKYCRTHINGFTIEGVINGCYPILRDYNGLVATESQDDIFDNLNAIIIPWDATPKQFAGYMKRAMLMDDKTYKRRTQENFELFKGLFDAKTNAKGQLDLILNNKVKELEVGENSDLVESQTVDVMENFFGIKIPIKWTM